MTISQRNSYTAGQNLNNQAANIDDNRLGADKTNITVAFGTPSVVTVKKGSIIEVNGNSYSITADETFNMTAGHNYITFTDNPSTAFASAASIGTYNSEKQGYYDGTGLIRTLKWYIDQSLSTYYSDISHLDLGNSFHDVSFYDITCNDITCDDIVGDDVSFDSVSTGTLIIGGVGNEQINGLRVLTGTTSSGDSTNVSYPTGYDVDNTVIIYASIDIGTDDWKGVGYSQSTSGYVFHTNPNSGSIVLRHQGITNMQSQPYRIWIANMV
jgi:hypothetical protein